VGMYTSHNIVVGKWQSRPPSQALLAKQEWYFRGFYLAKIFRVGFAGFLGFWLSSAKLRIVF